MGRDIFLSVVIPVFNESERIYHLDEVRTFFGSCDFPFEVIVVDDGSRDDTLQKLGPWQSREGVKVFSYPQNRGKGYAIRTGMGAAAGEFRLFMDIDLSTPLDEFRRFEPFLRSHDIIIGTRKNVEGNILEHQPWLRETLGKGFTFLSQVMLQVWLSDFTCGFKCFSAKAAARIFPRLTIDRWGFDSEILFLARKFGFSVAEVPVRWKNDRLTRVKFPQDILRSFRDLLTIRLNDRRGAYRDPGTPKNG
jgi:dolichyl-phosphate beta-glucosyltransferase